MTPREPEPVSAPSDFADRLEALSVSRETLPALERYVSTLLRWQRRINLIAASTIPDIWARHILDSLQIAPHLPRESEARLVDLGSGAGLPGIMLAIARPMFHVKLVESNAKKAGFLRAAAAELGLANVEILRTRVEDLDPRTTRPDYVTARALADLDRLLRMTAPIATPDTIQLFLKGADVDAELTRAREGWIMREQRFRSVTNAQSVLLKLSEVRRAP